jgi:predicted O-methyltransferase YrrM
MEGNPETARYARMTFDALDTKNIELIEGDFDRILPEYLATTTSLPQLVYVDGNHRYGPTISYFHQLLRGIEPNTILVFDDIHWSPEMEQAWAEIRTHPSVRYTIDIFFLGFVFFRDDFKVKQDFMIRF